MQKSTALGILGAGVYALQNSIQSGASLLDWKSWIFPVVVALLGYHSEDKLKF